ncbi:hypothetical protein [Gordonia bronchialis]|uniref:hypothetical protein n=1 Tax=Gordonia bronchialis TaxID=2054 RepID=UPI0021145EC6|nr:hypothetical protein [Gordonia bronchialis]
MTSADGHPVEGAKSFELTVAGSGTPARSSRADRPMTVVVSRWWLWSSGSASSSSSGSAPCFWLSRRSSGSGSA